MALSDARIAEIIDEVLERCRRDDERLTVERAAGLRCQCCNREMRDGDVVECSDCRRL